MGVGFDPKKVHRKDGENPIGLTAFLQPGNGTVTQIPIDQLDPWRDENGRGQPFHLYQEAKLQELAENIRENGIINPCIVRPRNGRYQILAGHNRTEAAKLAGLGTIPCIVKDVDDETAALFMVDSNLYQREEVLPSERAAAYALKLNIYRRRGHRSDLSGEPAATAAQRVADEAGDSARSVARYVRLLGLNQELLDMVDEGKIPVTVGYEIAGLGKDDQICLSSALEATKKTRLTAAQAEAITDAVQRDGQLLPETAEEILLEKKEKGETMTLSISAEDIPKKDRRRLKRDPALQRLLLETVHDYLNGGKNNE